MCEVVHYLDTIRPLVTRVRVSNVKPETTCYPGYITEGPGCTTGYILGLRA